MPPPSEKYPGEILGRPGQPVNRVPSAAEAPHTVEVCAVPAELHNLNARARVRCVHHPTASDVDAHVPEAVEEEHVPGPHLRARYSAAFVEERVRAVRQPDAEAAVRVVDEPRAVEAADRRAA